MRDYAKLGPQFWIGVTGKRLRAAGPFAQVVGLYLISSPHANMLGLYYMPKMFIAHETGLGLDAASKGLASCIEEGLCSYDEASEMVWVHAMAAYQVADALKPDDKRCIGIQNEYNTLPTNPFLPQFYEKYRDAFHMKKMRGDSTSHESRIEAPCKTLASQEQEQEHQQEQEHEQKQEHKQEQEQEHRQEHRQEHKLARAQEPLPPAAQKKSHHASKTPLPINFNVSPSVQRWAAERKIERLDLHLEHFVNACKRNGYCYADWDEALMEAIRKDWARLASTSGAAGAPSKLGKAGLATAANAQKWLEESHAAR
jgi:hypothetical protein